MKIKRLRLITGTSLSEGEVLTEQDLNAKLPCYAKRISCPAAFHKSAATFERFSAFIVSPPADGGIANSETPYCLLVPYGISSECISCFSLWRSVSIVQRLHSAIERFITEPPPANIPVTSLTSSSISLLLGAALFMSRYHQQSILPSRYSGVVFNAFANFSTYQALSVCECQAHSAGWFSVSQILFSASCTCVRFASNLFSFSLSLKLIRHLFLKTIMDTNRKFAKGIDMKYLFMLCCYQHERPVRDYDTTRTVCMSTGIRKLCPVLRNF